MVLVIDNYDSFTYNLVQYLLELKQKLEVRRNDKITMDEIADIDPAAVVISPGPCTPNEAGISLELIERLAPSKPILGVCLGHQCIGQAFGGNVVRAPELMHGKTSQIHHNGEAIFGGLPTPFEATRYHSLIVERETLPETLEVCAETEDGPDNGSPPRGISCLRRPVPPRVDTYAFGQGPASQLSEVMRSGDELMIVEATREIIADGRLSFDDAAAVMGEIMDGLPTPAQFGAFVAALSVRGETSEEIAGMATVMRARARTVDAGGDLVDTCGTGGDEQNTYNISTAAAFVVAGAGGKVAKHGNRAATSLSGSADVLEALGVKIDLPPQAVAECIRRAGVGFMFAQTYHPAMKFAAAAPARNRHQDRIQRAGAANQSDRRENGRSWEWAAPTWWELWPRCWRGWGRSARSWCTGRKDSTSCQFRGRR